MLKLPFTLPQLSTPKHTLLVAIPLVVISLSGISFYFFSRYQSTQKELSRVKSLTISDPQNDLIISDVSAIMELPQGETPQVATVSDKTKLADQPFFKKAENGDAIIIYAQAQKAILYRPSTKKIIDVSPIVVSSPTPNTSPQPSPKPKPSI